ncbi:cell wall glycosyl hydrolase [Fusarium napiforme]|uniref:Cell wall glycosyl hydrolase n=1 Tax=Fusarium napiforme TaxID=42672 RepID=A0A8H5NDI6_9HYPO|nr:cell wall glycosyl hydrolase [Fusarium napiforme]
MAYAQLFCTAVLCPSFGRLSDVYGRRNFLIVGNIIGAIGCVVAATAHEVRTVIIGSAFIGVGNAMQELALTCISEMVPRRSRFLAMGVFQASAFPALVFAPVIAFSIFRDGSWRGTFWLTFALDLAACALTILFYKPVHQYQRVEGKTELQHFLGLDWFENFLSMAGIAILAYYSGVLRVYERTGDKKYFDYVKRGADILLYPEHDGAVLMYNNSNSIDDIRIGHTFLDMYNATGDDIYKKAATHMRKQIDRTGRTPDGGFYHRYPAYID